MRHCCGGFVWATGGLYTDSQDCGQVRSFDFRGCGPGFGGRIGDEGACSFGDIAVTFFFPTKPLGCYGDGGAIFTDNDVWAELIRSFRIHGKGADKYDNVRIGMNS